MDQPQANPNSNSLSQLIEAEVKKQLQGGLFTARKLTDTPTDGLQVVNRNYVNLNGTVAKRPPSVIAIIGQKYFATDTNIPMTFDGNGNWRNGAGSIVASN